MGRRRRSKGKADRKHRIVAMLLIFMTGLLYLWLNGSVKPVLSEVAELQIREMMSVAVNDAVREKLAQEENLDFLRIESDENGTISYISANTIYINRFSSELAELIHQQIEELAEDTVSIPLGSLLGSEILSQAGPAVPMKIKPLGTAKVDFKTEFDSTGINQTKYKIYLQISSKAKPMIPFLSEEVEFSSVIPVAETVVVGDVPKTYLNISENQSGSTGERSAGGERAVVAGGTAAAIINGIDLSLLQE